MTARERVTLRTRWRGAQGVAWACAVAGATLAACGTAPSPPAGVAPPAPQVAAAARVASWPAASGTVAGSTERLLVYLPGGGDTLAGIAARFLGSADRAWQIADANGQRWEPAAGQPLIVPLVPPNPTGITASGVQTVPILCYHRFGNGNSKMSVAPAQFEAQLNWLARNHYQVLQLADLPAFLTGRQALPRRSVVITIDDGYESMHRYAFPLLQKYKVPATLFIYTDLVGARDGLSWAQLQEMAASGFVAIEAHSKTHRNLTERGADESDAAYRQAIENELRHPRSLLERRLGTAGVQVRFFAYPYGDANEIVLEAMRRQQYKLGLTVNTGGNPFYADPLLLRRTMIFGDHSIEEFAARLQVRRGLAQQ